MLRRGLPEKCGILRVTVESYCSLGWHSDGGVGNSLWVVRSVAFSGIAIDPVGSNTNISRISRESGDAHTLAALDDATH